MPKMQLTLTAEEYEQLGADLSLIASAARHNAENVSKTMHQQLLAYEYFFRGAYDVGPGEAEWPKPLDHTTCHQSSCDRCGKIDATVRVREIQQVPPDPNGPKVSFTFWGSRTEWRCDECGDTPFILGYDKQGQPEAQQRPRSSAACSNLACTDPTHSHDPRPEVPDAP